MSNNNNNRHFDLSYFRLLSIIVVAAVIASIATTIVVDNHFQSDLAENAYNSTQVTNNAVLESCKVFNIQDGISIIDSTNPLAREVFTISDCEATLEQGKFIELSNVEEQKYLEVLEEGNEPIVEDGEVVGSKPFQ